MVLALFTMNAGLDRARRQRKGASALSLLQIIAAHQGIRPSDIAEAQQVHPSLTTRQLKELEEARLVVITTNPADERSWLVDLTPAGAEELDRLTQVGLDRFALFVADWEPADVRSLASLLIKLQRSMAAVGAREQSQAGGRGRDTARMPSRLRRQRI